MSERSKVHGSNRRFEFMLGIDPNEPREDRITSLDELSRFRQQRPYILEDEGETMAHIIFNKTTGEVEYLSPEEYQKKYGTWE